MASVPYTINNGTPPYTISVKSASDNIERFVSYNGSKIVFNPIQNNQIITYDVVLVDGEGCTDFKQFQLNCIPPDVPCNNPLDIMFVIDESASISPTNFSIMKNGVKLIFDNLKPYLDSGLLKIGWSKFGNNSSTFCAFGVQGLTSDYATLVSGILATAQGGGQTPMASGFREGYSLMNNSGPRDVTRKMILITDGSPNQDENCQSTSSNPTLSKQTVENRVNTIKGTAHGTGKNTDILTVGIGINVNDNTWLRTNIASYPDYHFQVSNFTEFEAIAQDIAEMICDNPV